MPPNFIQYENSEAGRTGRQLSQAVDQEGFTLANKFGTDILIQAPDPKAAAAFYVEQLGFKITGEDHNMISLHGKRVNLFIEEGPAVGPVLEVTVDNVEAAKKRLVASGCEIVKDEPEFPRCYVKDPFGLIYNLTA
jgi:predicted enzyme related to lactoylglutathione lyase